MGQKIYFCKKNSMSVLVEFAMFPTDKGESVSSYVARIIKWLEEQKVSYQLTAMGTIFETETMSEALKILEGAYKQLENDCNRVYSIAKFDVRRGKTNRMQQKIASVQHKLQAEANDK
jgi:uncharacterized protein (TIGR00106 family)